ncbi:hypothetical protein BDN72DRAFT_287276 [Pluteus cervinus]|uniref:Uncharacterized protein n=1 Tax=Pluteus cervinus TaxID=181527 RepID=A0ACD3AF77_9AGAR|nr:hypothetical protein BDN72DRAFT_287276 [Pluteus cervinus]
MGNTPSARGHQEDTVDYGSLNPQGVYTGPRDWNHTTVTQLICARKLAPFYRPLEDYNTAWDDDQILAARKELPLPEGAEPGTRVEAPSTSSRSHGKKMSGSRDPSRPEAAVYRGAVECPICFLYYPPNINHSRCCDQAICTECFVQIKRSEPTTTHLVSEPAACPYCVQDNFGVVYTPPPWRAGIGSENGTGLWSDTPKMPQHPPESGTPAHKRRQKSYSAESPEVVTTDQIRPDWEAKLAAVRAAVARRANRRIIMRQVGDRLIPVGVTSGRVHPLSPEEAAAVAESTDNSGSRRSRRQQRPQNSNFEQWMGIPNQDLEELMIMEAMRLSLIEHEDQQRKEADEKKKSAASQAAPESPISEQDTPGPGPSTLEARASHELSSLSSMTSLSPLPIPRSSGSPIPPESGGSSRNSPTPSSSYAPTQITPSSNIGFALSGAAETARAILRSTSTGPESQSEESHGGRSAAPEGEAGNDGGGGRLSRDSVPVIIVQGGHPSEESEGEATSLPSTSDHRVQGSADANHNGNADSGLVQPLHRNVSPEQLRSEAKLKESV